MEENLILDLISKSQKQLDSRVRPVPKVLNYRETVLPAIAELIRELTKTKRFPILIDQKYKINAYTEACTCILIYEYLTHINDFSFSPIRNSIIPMHQIIQILEEHPYLILLLQRNVTHEEWFSFAKSVQKKIVELYGTKDFTKTYEYILDSIKEDDFQKLKSKLEKASAFHQFRYLMGFQYKEGNTPVSWEKILSQFTNTTFIVIHASYGVKRKDSIVIYKDVDRIRQRLILNEEKMKQLVQIIFPKKIYESEVPFDIVNHNESNEWFSPIICYDDGETLERCTFSIPTVPDNGIRLPIDFMERFINGACIRTLKETDINVYMQEWFFELYQDPKEDKENLLMQHTTLKQISTDSFSDNVETTIKKILSHKKLKNVLQGPQDQDLFYTYVHGLKLLPTYNMSTVEDYISAYIS